MPGSQEREVLPPPSEPWAGDQAFITGAVTQTIARKHIRFSAISDKNLKISFTIESFDSLSP